MDTATIIARARAADIRLEAEDGALILDTAELPTEAILDFFRRHKPALLAELLRVRLDFETASALDLKVVGASAYAEHPSTRVLLLGYAIGDGPVQVWRAGPMPDHLRQAIESGATIAAHNVAFNSAIWQAHQAPQGWPAIPWHRWSDTAARARQARLPASLKGVAAVLRLDVQKDHSGKLHMMKLARTAFRGGAEPSPEDLDRLAQYCTRDVEVLRAVDRILPALNGEALALAELDHAMNRRGMPVDLDLVRQLIVVRDAEDVRLTRELATLTKGAVTSPNQVARLLAFVAAHGIELLDVQADTLKAWDEDHPEQDDIAARAIRIRREFAHSAGHKLDTILKSASGTGLVRDGFVYHGAHTGRWSGRGVQLQNLPRNSLENPEATLRRLAAGAGRDPVSVEDDGSTDAKLSIKAQIAGSIRGLFLAPPDHLFVAVDLAQIESRVLCWLAGQADKLAAYAAGAEVYLLTAAALGSDSRDLGKLLDLSAGFGAGARVLLQKAKIFGLSLSEDEAIRHIERWREANHSIVSFWHALHHALYQAVESPLGADPTSVGVLMVWRTRGAIRVKLPSGRDLIYRAPRLEPREVNPNQLDLVADMPKGDKLLPVKLWHGLLTENVVQAIARDVLADAMLQLHRDSVPIVATVHDEVLAMVPAGQTELIKRHMIGVMSITPVWAPGLPLAAEGYVNRRFIKPPKEKESEGP